RPEPPAVLAYAPSFRFEPALVDRGLQCACGYARRAVFLRVEPGEILADDFESLVSLDALGTSVPAGHHAVAIEHVDRIIENGIDQEAMAPLVTDQHLR